MNKKELEIKAYMWPILNLGTPDQSLCFMAIYVTCCLEKLSEAKERGERVDSETVSVKLSNINAFGFMPFF